MYAIGINIGEASAEETSAYALCMPLHISYRIAHRTAGS